MTTFPEISSNHFSVFGLPLQVYSLSHIRKNIIIELYAYSFCILADAYLSRGPFKEENRSRKVMLYFQKVFCTLLIMNWSTLFQKALFIYVMYILPIVT